MNFEVDYPPLHIKKLTPYLDKVEAPKKNKKSKHKSYISLKHRAFAWYYCHNGNEKSDAFRRAFYSKYDRKKGVLVFSNLSGLKYTPVRIAVDAGHLFRKPHIQEVVRLIAEQMEREIHIKFPQTIPTLLEDMIIQATYDPSMFIDADGFPVFDNLKDVPKKYRCCIQSIETRYHGKDAQRKSVHIKLVDRDKIRNDILKLIPGLVLPEKHELLHKTIDKNGKEIGIVDYNKLSDEELYERLRNGEE
jgi:hypothetical protein